MNYLLKRSLYYLEDKYSTMDNYSGKTYADVFEWIDSFTDAAE